MIPLASGDPSLSTSTKRGLLTDMRKTDLKRIIFLWKSSVSFLEVVVGHRILPNYTGDLPRKVRRLLVDWRRQMRGNRSANGSSQIPGQRSPMGPSAEWKALSGSVRLNPAVL
ncbi:MAG: hypothetical protein NTY84_15505 [Verrucomicrobia bacterium]|nr:hypothetical protein [Verrucomicrobiota bacterium]